MTNTTKPEDSLFFAEVLEYSEETRQSSCTVGTILETMIEPDRVGLLQALEAPAVTGTAIAAILKRRGYQISSNTVQRHRRGGCGCQRG